MKFFDYLPAYILNQSPRIIAAFEMDFLRNLPAFQKSIPKGEKFTLVLQLGWSAELPEVTNELKSRLSEAKNAFPEARFIILANAPKELEVIKESNELETRKLALENQQKAYIQMITEVPYSLSEIEGHINDLTKTKEMLTEEISKADKKSDNYLEMIAELNCVSRGLRFFENKLEEKTKRSNNR